ncbi:MAG TPA: Hpt domain-containing protein, partial [Candidatus Acidoferrales bacterium]|nr:Hpt domain-containing protein [Candidatus Acidoferrales bacterium]
GRIAHTVKGVAGNLGIGAVQKAAEGVEHAIRNGDTNVSGLLEQFETVIQPVAAAIRHGLEQTAPAAAEAGRGPFDPKAAADAMANLKKLIDANDGGAADAFPALECALAGVVERPVLDALRDALMDFDFDAALTRLVEVDRQCGAVAHK